jgi:hypothetical protein
MARYQPREFAMDTTPPTSPITECNPPAVAAETAPAETSLKWGDRVVVIAFPIGLALLGFISLVDMLANLFR